MTKILNDYSIDNQFNSIDEFLDSLLVHTIPLFKSLDKYNIDLEKSSMIFKSKIANGITLFDILNIKNYPEITRLRDLLNKLLIDDPYWEQDFEGQDCLDKAYNSKTGLISFEHEGYQKNYIDYSVNKQSVEIQNSFKKMQLVEHLHRDKIISTREYMKLKHRNIHDFCVIEDKDYFEECILKDKILSSDIKTIVEDIEVFMEKYDSREALGRFSDNIETNLHEFRTTISDSREFRILYCIYNSKISFLNCFIKKQQITPEREKVMGRKLRDMVIGK